MSGGSWRSDWRPPFGDVDEFLTLLKSVCHRRRPRAGLAPENHLRAIFKRNGVLHGFNIRAVGKSKPDFLLPGIDKNRGPALDEARLSMQAAKTPCKDRWRQVLQGAAHIEPKHLCTLAPAMMAQLKELTADLPTIVAPSEILPSCDAPSGSEVISLAVLKQLVRGRDAGRLTDGVVSGVP